MTLAERAISEHRSQQKPMELASLGALLQATGCGSIIEIGSYDGGTAWYFAQLGLKVTAVDINTIPRVEGVKFHHGPSSAVMPTLGRADAVFIDGNHSLGGVTEDWELSLPVAKKLVAFHDITPHQGSEVDQLWVRLKKEYPCVEMIEENGDQWAGIGVVIL